MSDPGDAPPVSDPGDAPLSGEDDDRAEVLPARAKVNLRLLVFERDETGYHGLETIFARLDLHDRVRVEPASEGISLEVTGEAAAGVPTGAENLCWRAARAYLEVSPHGPGGARIRLDKRVPAGAGLGGGSADAAAVLRALDRASRCPLGERGLLRLAGELGSDVPFALLDVPMALGWERGRRLLPLQPPRPLPGLVVVPPFG
ncbi:MAG: hypothetical protein ACRELC_12715, partial [Gemmatimonadota bacterium]